MTVPACAVVGIDLGCEPVPDATTMLKFRRLLNDNKLGEALFAKVVQELQARGFKVNTGTIVGAPIIGAPCSTKNAGRHAAQRCISPVRASSDTSACSCTSEWTAKPSLRTAWWLRVTDVYSRHILDTHFEQIRRQNLSEKDAPNAFS